MLVVGADPIAGCDTMSLGEPKGSEERVCIPVEDPPPNTLVGACAELANMPAVLGVGVGVFARPANIPPLLEEPKGVEETDDNEPNGLEVV